jgi:hypothetical protein
VTPPSNPVVQQKPKRRWWRRILIGFGLLVVLLLGLVSGITIYLRVSGGNRLTAAIAEADRLEPNWRWDDLQSQQPKLADEENSAVGVDAVIKLLPEKWPTERPPKEIWEESQTLLEEVRDLDPPTLLDDKLDKEVRADLEKAAAALAEARQLSKYRVGRYPPFNVEDIFSSKPLRFQKTRQVVDLLRLDAARLAHDGKLDDALASCRAALAAGRSMGHEPSLIVQLVAIAGERLAWTGMERVLGQGEASEPALRACQEALADEGGQPSLLTALRSERAFEFEVIGWLVAGDTRRLALSKDQTVAETVKNPFGRSGLWLVNGWLQENQAVNLELMTEMVEAAKMPVEEQVPRFQELEAKAKALRSAGWPRGRYVLAALAIPAAVRVAQSFHRLEAERRCAITAMAVERYRLAHKRWPDSLKELVPALLAKVPTDPYDGQPLRFRRLEDGVVIYSIGPDGKDNGGIIDRKYSSFEDKDLGFRLWDVNKRRQAPKPAPKEEDLERLLPGDRDGPTTSAP